MLQIPTLTWDLLTQNKLLKDLINWKIPESKSFEFRTPEKAYPFRIDQIYNSAHHKTIKYSPLKANNITSRTPIFTKSKIITQKLADINPTKLNKFTVDINNDLK